MTVAHVHRRACGRGSQVRFWTMTIVWIISIFPGFVAVGGICAQSTSAEAHLEGSSATEKVGGGQAAGKQAADKQVTGGSDAVAAMPVAFDVVSIHPNNYDRSNHSHVYYSLNDSHFRSINATVMQIIQWAYELPDSRILDAPSWTTSTKYDIEARCDSAADARFQALPSVEARREKSKMVRAMLWDRFHLRAHVESRDLPVYEVVVAKGGPRFSVVKDAPRHVDSTSRGGGATLTITSSSHALGDLAELLYRYTGRVVIDKTGLTGNYTLAVHFALDDARAPGAAAGSVDPARDEGPSVFTALKEQLGLELKSAKARVEVLVIDHIDPPTDN